MSVRFLVTLALELLARAGSSPRSLVPGALALLLTACGQPSEPVSSAAPASEAVVADAPTALREAMVNSANPYATAAGVEILEAGGNAVDAAIAAHLVLGLVEPQSSGIGGGGFMLVHDAGRGETKLVDGRETAPAGARRDMFLDENGAPLPYGERIPSGHSVGVPGAVALYRLAHERYGALPWADLFAPAVRLADEGFEVSPRLSTWLGRMAQFSDIEIRPDTAAYFFPDGAPLAAGTLRRNPDYAATLRAIAERGPEAFYEGEIAAAIAARAQQPPRPGALTVEDIAAYEAVLRDPVCAPFRSYRVCTAPPPSSGVAVLEILGLVERFMPAGSSNDVDGWGAFIDAMLMAYADRDHYVADADFVPVPTAELADPRYWDVRAQERPAPGMEPVIGDPGAVIDGTPIIDRWGRDGTDEIAGTSHLSVIDSAGNAVSFTASVEAPFGSQRMAAGFVLNNELTDFASVPDINGKAVANAVEPGKRPRSSMSPTLIFDADGELFMATGSPGGNSILAYTAKSILGVVDYGLSVEAAVALPNVVARGLPVRVEQDRAPDGFVAGLQDAGYRIDASQGENSGLHPIVIRDRGLEGAPDPRREGVATRVPAAAP
ncbi:MAG: gamma-glutamyltransferase [Pseudomonadales bacterium]|jgi:gamma-glutamyltranspeptidase/glutathione hydrolase|nr:gamma-glutamyltransferase [Pseudomonadales bacterium]